MTHTPWLAHYDPGIPHNVDVPPVTLPELLGAAARDFPDAPAILFYGRTISYAELDRLATRCAVALGRAGVRPGERVVLVLPNVPQAVICYYGALRAGAIVVLTNPLFEAGALIRQVEDAQASSIVALSMFHPLVAQVRARVQLERVIFTNLKEYLPATQRRLFTLLRQEREGHRVPDELARRSLWLARMLAEQDLAQPLPRLDPLQHAVLLYTGGTTGDAKGVLHTHRSLVANAIQTSVWVPDLRRGRERVLCALPFSHAYGMTACMNLAVVLAAAMILLPTFETQNVLHAIRRERPTIFPGVPPMYAAITETKDARSYGLSSLRACLSGAAPLPIEVQESFERTTRARLVEGYGLSEAGPVTHANPLGDAQRDRHGYIGLPLPSTEARIVDASTLADLPPGQIGELLVRGPQVMQGYWNRPEETAEALLPDGWLRTGDLARMEPDGFFQVIERKKEMIVAGPYNIYPRDVEEVLYEHPKVLEAAVAGVPRDEGHADVKAFVVLRRGESATSEEIIQFLRERLSAYKLPSAVEFREALPRSAVGKVLRRVLIDETDQS
ncbi:MAG TPA: long-chain fatty acid--CoA ligase [Roseiflexaceae bacterium]|nr:long-chain fatty acid--CoA ligase [Roseiflexaceae bacterium]